MGATASACSCIWRYLFARRYRIVVWGVGSNGTELCYLLKRGFHASIPATHFVSAHDVSVDWNKLTLIDISHRAPFPWAYGYGPSDGAVFVMDGISHSSLKRAEEAFAASIGCVLAGGGDARCRYPLLVLCNAPQHNGTGDDGGGIVPRAEEVADSLRLYELSSPWMVQMCSNKHVDGISWLCDSMAR